jgi:predicted acetyltransferase
MVEGYGAAPCLTGPNANLARVSPNLREALPEERDRLERMLAEYLFEFDGRSEPYPYLDLYWEEPERLPFLIEVDREVVGLCLVRRRDDGWSIAEFWVQPSKRRVGVGRLAVEAVAQLGRSAGARYLEAKVHPDNAEALPFWLAVGFLPIHGPSTGVTVTRRPL